MTWIQTYTGKALDLSSPDPGTIDIEDIAHALSHLCRFTGHCQPFYSVAEHSVRVSHMVSRDLALCGLLHDASEAYLGDVSARRRSSGCYQTTAGSSGICSGR